MRVIKFPFKMFSLRFVMGDILPEMGMFTILGAFYFFAVSQLDFAVRVHILLCMFFHAYPAVLV